MLVIVAITLAVGIKLADGQCEGFRNYEYCLTDNLLKNYSTKIRPLLNESHSMDVKIKVALNNLDDIDVRQELMRVHAYIRLTWFDEFLVWNASDYNGIERITMEAADLWTPNVVIYNSAIKFSRIEEMLDFRLRVRSSGQVKWQFGGPIAAKCEINIEKYPFDVQVCNLMVGNWAHDYKTSNLVLDGVGFSDLWTNNSLWSMVGSPTATYARTGKYPRLVFTFTWRRQPRYYELNLIVPIVLLLAVTCWVFWLPVESGEKIGLSMAVLIAFSVFHNTVLENTPRTSQEMPALIVFVLVCLFLAALSTMGACLAIHLGKFYDGSRLRASVKLRNFAWLLARLFRMTADDPQNRAPEMKRLELRQHEWRFISAMVDRLMFIIWFLCCVLFCVAFVIWVRT